MSRQYEAKMAVLKAYPDDRVSGVDLFLEILQCSEDDFEYSENMSAEDYIYESIHSAPACPKKTNNAGLATFGEIDDD
ncbi:hypothetical protein EVB56_020 [Rhizobium phage RHph_Y1_10]|nr:hypothetical protein EVB56_020 [Rhizobium phage RHph_Y1_10]